MNIQKTIVSAIVPCYNNSEYVGKAIESLLNQTRVPDEIVVVNDGSTDTSWKVIQKIASNNQIVKAFENDKNIGIPRTRNRLIQEMRSDADYVVILDADDVSTPNRIETQLSFLEKNPKYALVGSDIGIINNDGEKIGIKKYPYEHNEIVSKVLHFNPFAQSALMIRTDIFKTVGTYNEKLSRVQDYDLWIRIIKVGHKVHNISQPLTLFRRHKDQGKETKTRKSIYYSWKVRARYLWLPKFFSFKGMMIFIAYTFAMMFPKIILNKIYFKFFIEKYHEKK